MRISFSQPVFIPYGGFFGRQLNSDLMIILDQTQFARGFTFVNRNRLKGPAGEIRVTVPVKKKNLGRQTIRQLRLHQPERFSARFLALLRHYYGHSLYYQSVSAELKTVLEAVRDNFPELALELISKLKSWLEIGSPQLLQSELGLTGRGPELLIDLAKEVKASEILFPYLADRHFDSSRLKAAGLKLVFLKYDQLPYPQFWGDFLANLSALDLYLCCGPQGRQIIQKSSRIIK
ncbi:MAG: WbqC family protein [Candidatus Saccharicenans sp.]|nr:WbqC family protein [Candidatus Saccharicenans sp.]